MNEELWTHALEWLTVGEQLCCVRVSKVFQSAACSCIAGTRLVQWKITKEAKTDKYYFEDGHQCEKAAIQFAERAAAQGHDQPYHPQFIDAGRLDLVQMGHSDILYSKVFDDEPWRPTEVGEEKTLWRMVPSALGRIEVAKEEDKHGKNIKHHWRLVYQPPPSLGEHSWAPSLSFEWQRGLFEGLLTESPKCPEKPATLTPFRLMAIVWLIRAWLEYGRAHSDYTICQNAFDQLSPSKSTKWAELLRWSWFMGIVGGWALIMDDETYRKDLLQWRIWVSTLCLAELVTSYVFQRLSGLDNLLTLRLTRNQYACKWRYIGISKLTSWLLWIGQLLVYEILRPTFLCYTTTVWIYAGWDWTAWMLPIPLAGYLLGAVVLFAIRAFRAAWVQGFFWTIVLGQPALKGVCRHHGHGWEKELLHLATCVFVFLSLALHLWQPEYWPRLYTLLPWVIFIGSFLGVLAWRAWLDPDSRRLFVLTFIVLLPHLVACKLWILESCSYVHIWAWNLPSFIALCVARFRGWRGWW